MLYTNPREDQDKVITDSWIFGPVLEMVGEFEASTKKYLLIAMGTPDPYTPPPGAKPLLILVAGIVGVFCIAGWLPGRIAKARGHPQAQAVTVAVPGAGRDGRGARRRSPAVAPKAIEAVAFVVLVRLDDDDLAKRLPAGSTGTATRTLTRRRTTGCVSRPLVVPGVDQHRSGTPPRSASMH